MSQTTEILLVVSPALLVILAILVCLWRDHRDDRRRNR